MTQFQFLKKITTYSLAVVLSGGSSLLFAATNTEHEGGYVHVGMMMDGSGPGMMGSTSSGHNNTEQQAPSQGETIARGEQLEQEFCIQCHAMPDPQQHTVQEWPYVVARMNNYMHYRYMPAPDPQQTDEIINFLAEHARH